jgi:hypothetical protein
MTKIEQENTSAIATSNLSFPLASATLLIASGIVFQLLEVACRNIHLGNLWLVSVLASDIWNILSVQFNVPTAAVFFYWPLVLVCMGLAILLAIRENHTSRNRRAR